MYMDTTILVITCILPVFQQTNVSLTILGQIFKEKNLFLIVKEHVFTNQWTLGAKVYNSI